MSSVPATPTIPPSESRKHLLSPLRTHFSSPPSPSYSVSPTSYNHPTSLRTHANTDDIVKSPEMMSGIPGSSGASSMPWRNAGKSRKETGKGKGKGKEKEKEQQIVNPYGDNFAFTDDEKEDESEIEEVGAGHMVTVEEADEGGSSSIGNGIESRRKLDASVTKVHSNIQQEGSDVLGESVTGDLGPTSNSRRSPSYPAGDKDLDDKDLPIWTPEDTYLSHERQFFKDKPSHSRSQSRNDAMSSASNPFNDSSNPHLHSTSRAEAHEGQYRDPQMILDLREKMSSIMVVQEEIFGMHQNLQGIGKSESKVDGDEGEKGPETIDLKGTTMDRSGSTASRSAASPNTTTLADSEDGKKRDNVETKPSTLKSSPTKGDADKEKAREKEKDKEATEGGKDGFLGKTSAERIQKRQDGLDQMFEKLSSLSTMLREYHSLPQPCLFFPTSSSSADNATVDTPITSNPFDEYNPFSSPPFSKSGEASTPQGQGSRRPYPMTQSHSKRSFSTGGNVQTRKGKEPRPIIVPLSSPELEAQIPAEAGGEGRDYLQGRGVTHASNVVDERGLGGGGEKAGDRRRKVETDRGWSTVLT